MGFTTDYANISDQETVKPGKYEVIIAKADEIVTKSGASGIQLVMVIRNDVDQQFQNRSVYHTLWKKKEPDERDMQVNGYSFKQIMSLAKACALPDGKNYKNLSELFEDIVRKCVKVTVYHEEYQGKTSVRVSYINPTERPDCKHLFKSNESAPRVTAPYIPSQYSQDSSIADTVSDNFQTVTDDDDLPF